MSAEARLFSIHVRKLIDENEHTHLLTLQEGQYLGFGIMTSQGIIHHEIKQNGGFEVYRWDQLTTPDTPQAVMINNHPYIPLGELTADTPIQSLDVPFKEGEATLIFSLE